MTEEEMSKRAHLIGPARAFKLFEKVPTLFSKRGWSTNEDAVAVAIAALSCVSLGAFAQKFRVPLLVRELKEWAFALETGKATALEIVALMELRDLLSTD